MKKYNLFALALLAIATTMLITSCQKDDLATPTPEKGKGDLWETRGSSTLFDPNSTLTGQSIKTAVEEWWKYALSFDCEGNPINDGTAFKPTGKYNTVILLGANKATDNNFVNVARTNSLLIPIISFLKNDACQGVILAPPPGQNVFKVLTDGIDEYIDQALALKVFLDGRQIQITAANRVTTDLFYFTGNKALYDCLGTCVTGDPQPAASDGYWITIPKLGKGKHQLRIHSDDPSDSIVSDVVYYINVR